MNDNLKKIYKSENDIWGDPQEYKGVKFYPIKIMDTEERTMLYSVFGIPKNHIKDAMVFKMSYLKFLLLVCEGSVSGDGSVFENRIIKFLKYITKTDDIRFSYEERPDHPIEIEKVQIVLHIGKVRFNEGEFGDIREIILEQNGTGVDYIEEFNEELEKILNNQKTGITTSLSDEVFTLCSMLQVPISIIKDYTMFQFQQHMRRAILLADYNLYRPLEASGQITLKSGEIKHFLAELPELGRYGSILIRQDKSIFLNSDMATGV